MHKLKWSQKHEPNPKQLQGQWQEELNKYYGKKNPKVVSSTFGKGSTIT